MEHYDDAARKDAKLFIEEYQHQIVEQVVSGGKASADYHNDYDTGSAFFHESYVDKRYTLMEAAVILEELSFFEEIDSGLWEGQAPQDAVITQAAYTYAKAVGCFISGLVSRINDEIALQLNPEETDQDVRELAQKVVGDCLNQW